jgi:hypothetical protein
MAEPIKNTEAQFLQNKRLEFFKLIDEKFSVELDKQYKNNPIFYWDSEYFYDLVFGEILELCKNKDGFEQMKTWLVEWASLFYLEKAYLSDTFSSEEISKSLGTKKFNLSELSNDRKLDLLTEFYKNKTQEILKRDYKQIILEERQLMRQKVVERRIQEISMDVHNPLLFLKDGELPWEQEQRIENVIQKEIDSVGKPTAEECEARQNADLGKLSEFVWNIKAELMGVDKFGNQLDLQEETKSDPAIIRNNQENIEEANYLIELLIKLWEKFVEFVKCCKEIPSKLFDSNASNTNKTETLELK